MRAGLINNIDKVQNEINKIGATSKNLFISGWRPFIGWVCGINLFYLVLVREFIIWGIEIVGSSIPYPPAVGQEITIELVVALLGLGSLRTIEKLRGKS
jgi:hypothetical protein